MVPTKPERRGEERYCRKDLITGFCPRGEERRDIRGDKLPKGADCRYLSERRGEEKYCRKELMTGVCPRAEERRDIVERT